MSTHTETNGMPLIDDPRKRPLLTAEQLRNLHRVRPVVKKGTPREEFEKLFRHPSGPALAQS